MGYKKEFLIDYSDLERFCEPELEAIDSAAAAAEESTEIDAADFWGMMARCDSDDDIDTAGLIEEIASMMQNSASQQGPTAEDLGRAFSKLLSDLKAAFQQRTGGLGLYLRALPPDVDFGHFGRPPVEGGPIDPFVFIVTNMYALTPAGERLKDVVAEYQWYE